MENEMVNLNEKTASLRYDFGTFEGFNFRDQSAITRTLSAEEVLNWDHDRSGEAEFWPAGDNGIISLILSDRTTCASTLLALDGLLADLSGDEEDNLLRIYYLARVQGERIDDIKASEVEDLNIHIFKAAHFTEVRCTAAYELFEMYWPEGYAAWESCQCDGFNFDVDRFLDSPQFSTIELSIRNEEILLVVPN